MPLSFAILEPPSLGERLWANKPGDPARAVICSASFGGRPCIQPAFVRIWRGEKSSDAVDRCCQHAQVELAIFFVEPVCRSDFHSLEYNRLLERSTVGQRVAAALK